MPKDIHTVNIEQGMPDTLTALRHMGSAMRTARAAGIPLVKLIHGYGSSGTGGRIRQSVHKELLEKKRRGQIKDFIKGEDFSPFNESTQRVIQALPAITKDSDYCKENHGITIIFL